MLNTTYTCLKRTRRLHSQSKYPVLSMQNAIKKEDTSLRTSEQFIQRQKILNDLIEYEKNTPLKEKLDVIRKALEERKKPFAVLLWELNILECEGEMGKEYNRKYKQYEKTYLWLHIEFKWSHVEKYVAHLLCCWSAVARKLCLNFAVLELIL